MRKAETEACQSLLLALLDELQKVKAEYPAVFIRIVRLKRAIKALEQLTGVEL